MTEIIGNIFSFSFVFMVNWKLSCKLADNLVKTEIKDRDDHLLVRVFLSLAYSFMCTSHFILSFCDNYWFGPLDAPYNSITLQVLSCY